MVLVNPSHVVVRGVTDPISIFSYCFCLCLTCDEQVLLSLIKHGNEMRKIIRIF